MNPEEFAKLIDQLSTKNDRWLFIAMLVIVLVFCAITIRYLVKRNEEQSKDHNGLVREMVVVLHECKQMMERGNEVMTKVLDRLKLGMVLLCAFAAGLSGCAGSGPNGEFTPRDIESVTRGIHDAVGMYEHLRYPDRPLPSSPVYPPGAPFPVYPPSQP